MGRSAQPSPRALTALSLFATLGTLTEAADQLGVTRSALSHRIGELERQLGVALVRKAGRRIVLTEDGERLLSGMGDALDRIEAAVEPFRRDHRQIRLSTVATFASHWLIPRIVQFQRQHPQIEVVISTTTRPVDLGAEEMDCAIRHGHGAWKGLTATLLFSETLMPVAAPDLVAGFAANVRKGWHGAPLIRARSRFADWSRWHKHDPELAGRRLKWLTVETRAQALDAALAGAGVALTDMAYLAAPLAGGRLEMLAERPLELSSGYYFVHPPKSRNLHLLMLLRDWVIEAARPFRCGNRL